MGFCYRVCKKDTKWYVKDNPWEQVCEECGTQYLTLHRQQCIEETAITLARFEREQHIHMTKALDIEPSPLYPRPSETTTTTTVTEGRTKN